MTSVKPTTRPLKDYEGAVYRNSGTYDSPTLVELDNLRALDAPDKKGEDEVTVRRSKGYKWVVGANRELELNFQMMNVGGDANVAAIRTAYNAGTPVEFFVMDFELQDSAAVGVRAFHEILECTLKQDDNKSQYYDVKSKPTWSAQPPEPIVGGSSWETALGIGG